MPIDTHSLAELPEVSDLLLKLGKVRLRIVSRSMVPTLRPGDEIAVEPASTKELSPDDIVLFRQDGQLVCHRLVAFSEDDGALLTRGDAANSEENPAGERVAADRLLGRVVGIRRRSTWVGLKETVKETFFPLLSRWLPHLQRLSAYRLLIRPLALRGLSYHVGLASGSRWYDWQELGEARDSAALPPTSRPHLLIAKCGSELVGWSRLVPTISGWQPEGPHVRMRYRGLGLESDLECVARGLGKAR